ncbi:Hypothetical protein, putative [Bodo saltans]|uniref:Uncharacterized protein n=1 Tax=Bodo saltans TaxID=75058 RepID=A0A0S4J614_BODSA|nr:Hypothetical protein, putative [Bodo saltans]|eukprot:CUG85779.1 Hypothetical protein, putative [Bodo saltans]
MVIFGYFLQLDVGYLKQWAYFIVLLLSWCIGSSTSLNTVVVPCNAESTFGPNISTNTTLLLEYCDDSTARTSLVVIVDRTTVTDSISVIVQHCRNVDVQVTTSPLSTEIVNLTKLSVWMENITNNVETTIFPSCAFSI